MKTNPLEPPNPLKPFQELHDEDLVDFKKHKYYKVIHNTWQHHDMRYKEGLNIDIRPFEPRGMCHGSGMYFTSAGLLSCFLGSGSIITEVTLPKKARVYVENEQAKTDMFRLKVISPTKFLRDNPMWDGALCKFMLFAIEHHYFRLATYIARNCNDLEYILRYNINTIDNYNEVDIFKYILKRLKEPDCLVSCDICEGAIRKTYQKYLKKKGIKYEC